MSVQIDSIHIPLRFLAAHQMQEVQTQGMVTPESASESGRLQLSDYRSGPRFSKLPAIKAMPLTSGIGVVALMSIAAVGAKEQDF